MTKKFKKKNKRLFSIFILLIIIAIGYFAVTGHKTGIETIDNSYVYSFVSDIRENGINSIFGSFEKNENIPQPIVKGLEIPSYVKNHQVVSHPGFTLSYNEEYEQADWVAYTLTIEELNDNSSSRQEDFREDPEIVSHSAHLSDYRKSGYDRGHLCPSNDRNSSKELNSQTFYLSNMSPQIHRFNAGLWLNAENAVRDAARQYKTAYIVTGPIFSTDMETIGECNVAVPKSFYKVILVKVPDGSYIAIGMIMPQEYQDGSVKNYLCSVNDVEKATGIDFFPTLDDSIEEKIESTFNPRLWPKSFN